MLGRITRTYLNQTVQFGDVKRAGAPLGSIQGGFKLRQIMFEDCTCGADLLISKAKNGHLDKLRVGQKK